MEKIKTLLWLKFKLSLNSMKGRKGGNIATAIISIIILLSIFGFSLGIFFGIPFLSAELLSLVLFAGFSFVFLFLLVMPLMAFNFNESYDVSKLFIYPLTYNTIFFASILTSMLDLWFLLIFPLPIIAVSLALGLNAFQAIFILISIVLFLVLAVGLSQIIIGVMFNLLKSRRFKDISTVIAALIGLGIYLLSQSFRFANFSDISAIQIPAFFDFLPPKLLADLIIAIHSNNFFLALPEFFVLLVSALIVIFLGARLTKFTYFRVSIKAKEKPLKEKGFGRKLPFSESFNAIFWKELKFFGREPNIKINLIVPFIVAIVLFWNFAFIPTEGFSQFFAPLAFFFISGFIVFLNIVQLSLNIFGMEDKAVSFLFSSPIDRKSIFLGKNFLIAIISFIEVLIVAIALGIYFNSFALIPFALIFAVSVIFVFLGFANLLSIYFPRKLAQIKGMQRNKYSSGWATLFFFIAGNLLVLPIILSFALPIAFTQFGFVLPFAIIFSLIYGAILYFVFLRISVNSLAHREQLLLMKILEK